MSEKIGAVLGQVGTPAHLGDRLQVELGLAYSEPTMSGAVEHLERAGIRKIVVLPVKKFSPTLRFVHPYYDDPAYIAVLAASVARQLAEGPEPDRIVLSYHGLPQHFVDEGDPYVEHCETTRLLAQALGWEAGRDEMAYQSRFGRTEWITPYLQPRLTELAGDGIERPVIISPGFTTDCLETLHELGIEGRELFADGGGDPAGYRTVACLNDEPAWLDYAASLVETNARGW